MSEIAQVRGVWYPSAYGVFPVVCVRFPKTFQFLAHQPKSGDFSNWRPTLKYARTIHDAEYAPDADQFKLKLVYLTSRVSS